MALCLRAFVVHLPWLCVAATTKCRPGPDSHAERLHVAASTATRGRLNGHGRSWAGRRLNSLTSAASVAARGFVPASVRCDR